MLLPGEFELGLWDSTDQAGAAGYHDTDPQGRPYAKAFRNEADDFGASEWSLTAIATHELAEIMRDPFACWWIDRGTYEEALELCDRVEGYSFGLQFGGAEVQCADFLTAAALDPKAPTGPWDYMNKLSSQTGISPDGYAIVRTASYESNRGAFDKPDVRSGKSFRRRNWKTKTAIGRTGKRLGMQAGIERRCPVCQTPLANPKHMVAPCSVPVTPKPTTEPNTK
jgi:hypothetical protein